MIEANLTPEELDILQYVREFAQREVKPLAREIDRKKEVPEKLINRMNEMGLFASYIPKEYGGAGLSFSFLARVIEELSRACASTALVLDGALTLFADPLIMFGSEKLKQKYLTRVAKGAIGFIKSAYLPSFASVSSYFFACDFSALESISNQCATSSNCSSLAVLANPGYICVYS